LQLKKPYHQPPHFHWSNSIQQPPPINKHTYTKTDTPTR